MSRVNTVLGPIPAEELGFVAVHEHIGYGMPGSELDTRWWKTPEQRYQETVPKLRAFHQRVAQHEFIGGMNFSAAHTEIVDIGKAGGGEIITVAAAAGGFPFQGQAEILTTGA